jgi:hypothetical protein
MILAGLLAKEGLEVASCTWCGAVFPAELDYAGRPHAGRRYCRRRCRALAAAYRRLPRRRHARTWAALTAMHDQERAGQEPFPGQDPLPDVPPLQEATA